MKIQFQNDSITIFESALYQTTSTVIQHPNFVLIVDPNWLPIEIEAIQNFVKKIQNSRPIYLLFTHSDYDHIIGYQAFPNAKIIASKAFQEQPQKDKIIQQILDFDDENYITRSYPIEFPKVDIITSVDQEKIMIEGVEFVFYQALGHNDDGIFTIIPSLNIFLCGDYLCDVEFPFIYLSGLEYLETLKKADQIINQYELEFLIAGHGNFSKTKSEMLTRVNDSKKYIEDLIFSIKNNSTFDLDSFLEKYNYPKGMRSSHFKNIEILRNELPSN